MAYKLTLHFTAGDRTVSVLKEGYSSGNQVGARGKHATQTCQLSIRSYEVSAMLLQEEAPLIRGELKDDDLVIFQGVVRPYQTVSAKNATENVFSLQLMDDTEILKNASITDTEEYLDKTLAWCVQYLYDMADIPEQLDMPGELSEIPIPFFNLNPERYPKVSEQLEAMLWEYGYDYKFSGTVCRIIRTWIESASGIGTVNVRNTLRVQRDDNWSDGVKVNYGIMEICRQIPLASWKEDVSDLQWWRYALPWSYSTSAGRVKRTIAYDPFYGLPASSKPKDFKTEYILSAQNLRANASRCEIHSVTPHAQSVEIDFSWDVTQNYVWGEPVADWPFISVVGDIIYAVPGDYQENIVGEKPDEYTLVYIRSEEGAKAFAEREYKRAKCAPITFSFQSLEDYEAGSFYRLADSVTGINAVIRILSCSMDANGIYSVKAESADYIGMVVEVEELRLRDALDVGASVVLTASTDAVGEGASVTVTASGRLLDIIEVEGDETFSYEWELNGEHVPAWDDEKEITATFSELGDDNNAFKFKVYHSEGGQKILIGTGVVSTLKTVEGKDGDSAEIQYAIGDSFVDPPQDDMLWNGELMTWDGEAMTWNDGEYSADVPEMERARYIWMRTRVGDEPWQYTRLTGTTSWDPENLGVCTTATPTQSKEGLNLVAGDYFVAGATFTEDGVTYSAGFAYTYNGTSWAELNLTTAENARKASNLLNSLATANVQIPASTSPYSVWLWAKNFVAQNAVVDNLFSQAITILSGGYIKGGDRYNSDGTIADWNENGFWFGSNGKLKCNLQSDNNGNTFVGTDVGINTTLGGAPSGNYNTAMGYGAMKYNTTGDKNVAIGYYALASNTIGTDNIAIGYSALAYNTLGVDNVAIGNAALASSNGLYNVAIGYGAMNRNTSGSHNAAIGTEALLSCTTGDYNVALGPEALHNSTTGAKNIALGYLAMSNNSTGGNNICIGYATTTYLATGHNQINLNDAIICLEFNAARQSKNLYSVLNSYFPSNKSVGAMGVFNGQSVTGLQKTASGISVVGVNGYAIATLTGSSTETFTGRTIIAFINPNLSDSDRSSKDCLSA